MAGLWRRFVELPAWVRVLISLATGLVLLAVGAATSAGPDGGRDLASSATTSPPTPAASSPLPPGDDTEVTRITDGDTLVVTGGTRIRLIGIDTPEAASRDCYSSEATDRLRDLVGPGTTVRLVYDVGRLDRFGRTLAYVYRVPDGLFVNLALARDGFAQQLTVPPNVRHAADFGQAVADARGANRGLWASCPTPPGAAAA